jgi:hypothetical protein
MRIINWTATLPHGMMRLSPLFSFKEIDFSPLSSAGFFLPQRFRTLAFRRAPAAPLGIRPAIANMRHRTHFARAACATAMPCLSSHPMSASCQNAHFMGFDCVLTLQHAISNGKNASCYKLQKPPENRPSSYVAPNIYC